MSLNHTLARSEIKQPTTILAKKMNTANLIIIHHTTDKRAIGRNTTKRKQEDGNGKNETR